MNALPVRKTPSSRSLCALLVGLVYDALRTEVALLGIGGVMFLTGRWLQQGD